MKDGLLTRGQVVLSLSFAVVPVCLAVACTGDLGVELPGGEAMELPGEKTMAMSPNVDLWPGEQPECEFIMPYTGRRKEPSLVWVRERYLHSSGPPETAFVDFGTVERAWELILDLEMQRKMEKEDSLYPNVVRAECDMKGHDAIAWIRLDPKLIGGKPHPQFHRVGGYPSTKIKPHAWFFGWWGDWGQVEDWYPLNGPIPVDAVLFIGNKRGRRYQGGWKDDFPCRPDLGQGLCVAADRFPFNVENDSTGVRTWASYALEGCREDPETRELTCRDRWTTRGPP